MRHAQPGGFPGGGELRAGQPVQHQRGIERNDGRRDRIGDAAVARGEVVQRAVRLDVRDPRAFLGGDRGQPRQLRLHQPRDPVAIQRQFTAAEVLAVLERRMRADRHAVRRGTGVSSRASWRRRRRVPPQAMLAELINGTMAASPPHPSPRSQLKSRCGMRRGRQVAGTGSVVFSGAAVAGCVASAGVACVAAGACHSFASGLPPSICARTSGIGGPP